MIKKTLFAAVVFSLLLSSIQMNNVMAHDDGNDLSNYIQPNDELVKKIVQEKISASMSMLKKAEILYNYVADNIDYRSDQKVWGVRDYWQFPATTIKKKTGDCEDQAILLTSLLRSAGFSRNNVRLVYGKIVDLISGKLKGYHCWVEIKLSTEELSEISSLSLEELAGKNVTLHTNDGDISFTIDENKLRQYSVLGIGDRNGWIPLDTSCEFIKNKIPIPFWMWRYFGYRVYLLGLCKAQPIETYIDPLPPTAVILSMEKEEYQIGETIVFTVTNTGEENITFTNSPPYTIYRVIKIGFYEVLECVYPYVVLPVVTTLEGGESVNFSWNQKDNNGEQVPDGEYVIVLGYHEGGEGRQLSKNFKIVSPAWEWRYHNFSQIVLISTMEIKSKIYAPKEIEIGKEYEIPIYFSRESRIIPLPDYTLNLTTPDYTLNLTLMPWHHVPLDVNIFVGLGKTSNRTICRITIELVRGSNWQIDIPLKEAYYLLENNTLEVWSTGKIRSGYVQTISLQIPSYHYITDIPYEWDGPYKIVIKTSYSSSLLAQPPRISVVTTGERTLLHNITCDRLKIMNTPVIVNTFSPDNISLKTGLLLGSTISPYYIEEKDNEYYLFNNKYKIKVEAPFIINNSKLFLTSNLTLSAMSPSINIAPETIVVKEKLKSVKSITLKMEDFSPVYEVKGYKKEKLLGIFPVEELVTIKIDGVTGEKLSEKEPWWGFLT